MLASDGVFEHGELRVLDLYSGSGALGLEALSRGAQSVVMVESARPALAAIRQNTGALGAAEAVTVLAMRVEKALSVLEGLFHLVLVDPPYADVQKPGFAEVLGSAARLLAAAGVLVLEHASGDAAVAPSILELDRQRRHGDTTLSLFRRVSSNDPRRG
jgi:16S rRNA (guanine966-N2)-methyltransferase